MINEKFIKFFNKKNKKSLFFFFAILIGISAFFITQVYSADPVITIITQPAPKSSELPSAEASATADPGKTIVSASYQIYPSDESPSGTWRDCTANPGFAFNNNNVEFSCVVASLSDGSYKMNIRAVDSDSAFSTIETNVLILDRLAPVVYFDDLPGDPLLIDYNDPIFYGDIVDAWTSVVSVEYKWTVASTTSSVPSDFGDSGWSACSITGSGTAVEFTCNPLHNFADSLKGDEYRMHVRATDEIGNLSGNTNYYKFQVDTTPPHTLAITYPDAAGITLNGNHSYNITWVTPVDDFELGSAPITIEYSATGAFAGEEVLIVDNQSASGPYSWTVPAALDTSTARVKITATDLAGNSFSSTSANAFTVIPYSAPNVSIDPITNNITSIIPINFTASASDPQNIVSARYRIDGGSWVACSAQDGAFGGSTEILECNNVSVTEGSHIILVEATDGVGDTGSDSYSFIYDNTPPVVDAGTLGTINQATAPGATATDVHSSIVSRSWTKVSGPGTINFSNPSTTNPSISANTNGAYVAQLEACDLAGHCASDTVSFTWTDEPLSVNIIEPSGGERLSGSDTFNITWTNPGGTSSYTYDLSYSTNGGSSWSTIITDIAKTTFLYNWNVPNINSENVTVRIQVVDSGDSVILTDISSIFSIDSMDPVVDAGTLGTISTPTAPGATASDNFDSLAELTYAWTSISGPGTISYGGGTNILNPTLSGTVTGNYTSRLTVTDRAGNSAYDEVSFYWDGNPPDFSVLNPVATYYKGGDVEPIVWTESTGASYYSLDYTINGTDFISITSSTLGTATSSGLYYNWTLPLADSNQAMVRVTAYDIYDNSSSALSATFTIDSSAPIVDAGALDLIYVPTAPGATASDGVGSGIASYAWSQISGAGTITFDGGTNILDPIVSANQSGTYEIQLLVTDNVGLSSSDTVSFYYSVEPPAPVITSPGSEEVLIGGQDRNIVWEIDDPGDINYFSIDYSMDSGSSWNIINSNVASTTRSLTWTVPNESSITSQIRIVVNDTEGYSATSTRGFIIDAIPPNPTITSPSSGEVLIGGHDKNIVWEIDDPGDIDYFSIDYSTDGGSSWNIINSNVASTTRLLAWTVPNEHSATSQIRIVVNDIVGHSATSTRDFVINAIPPNPTIVSPSSGEVLIGGHDKNIVWEIDDPGDIDYFSIDYSIDGGSSWNSINSNVASTTRLLAWTVPNEHSATSQIRIVVNDIVGYSATSTRDFIIDAIPPNPTITSPSSGEVLMGGLDKNIRWEINDPGDIDYFSIDYSTDGGSSWNIINSNLASTTRLLTWTVPSEDSATSQIRIVVNDIVGYSASSTRDFIMDSTPPTITMGSIGTTTTATSSGTVVTDNIDTESQMDFIWTEAYSPDGGILVFSPTHETMDPEMAGTVTGEYSALIYAKDRAGHSSVDSISFYWDGDPDIPIVTSPTSTVFAVGGQTQDIDWYLPDDPELSYFEIKYSIDSGATWNNIATTSSSTRTYAWDIPEGMNSDSVYGAKIEVRAYDIYNNESPGFSPNFTIDSEAPVIDAGTITSPISNPTRSDGVSVVDNLEDFSDLTLTWTPLTLPYPNATLTISDINATSTLFSGDMTGDYSALLTVSDRAGNTATSSVSFTWDSIYDPVLTAPEAGDVLPGGQNTDLIWTLTDPGDLTHIESEYSIDNGLSWQTIDNSISTSSRELTWLVPDTINSTSSLARIMTVNQAGIKATSTSGIFIIDSTSPIVDAGSFGDIVNAPTRPGATASDNIDTQSQLSYQWIQQSAPNGGNIIFSDGASTLSTRLSGDRNGNYVARLTVYDRAGNSASDTVSFKRDVGSTGGGGGGGGGGVTCDSVVYGDYGACFDDVQYRSIISTSPENCTLTQEQKDGQQRSCSESNNCETVTYGDWGTCTDGVQYREIISRYPEECNLTDSQQAESTQSCTVNKGPFDEDALDVMERARRNFAFVDEEMLKRVTGQILIQVEEYGRAWYVSAQDQRRYYLGSPTNAFSVMSLIGLGVKNDRLSKIPVGLLEGSLTLDKDSDGDGLPDRLEEGLLTNPFNKDSDGDGYDDRTEVLGGFDPNGPGKMPFDSKVLQASLGHIYIQVETNGEAWYIEPRAEKRFYLGRPIEAFAIMREFGLGITNEDLNKIPVGQFTSKQLERITKMLEDRKRELEAMKQ